MKLLVVKRRDFNYAEKEEVVAAIIIMQIDNNTNESADSILPVVNLI